MEKVRIIKRLGHKVLNAYNKFRPVWKDDVDIASQINDPRDKNYIKTELVFLENGKEVARRVATSNINDNHTHSVSDFLPDGYAIYGNNPPEFKKGETIYIPVYYKTYDVIVKYSYSGDILKEVDKKLPFGTVITKSIFTNDVPTPYAVLTEYTFNNITIWFDVPHRFEIIVPVGDVEFGDVINPDAPTHVTRVKFKYKGAIYKDVDIISKGKIPINNKIIAALPEGFKLKEDLTGQIAAGGIKEYDIIKKVITFTVSVIFNGSEIKRQELSVQNGYPCSISTQVLLPQFHFYREDEIAIWDNKIADDTLDGEIVILNAYYKLAWTPIDPDAAIRRFYINYKYGDTLISRQEFRRSKKQGLFPKSVSDLTLPADFKLHPDIENNLPTTYNTDLDMPVVYDDYELRMSYEHERLASNDLKSVKFVFHDINTGAKVYETNIDVLASASHKFKFDHGDMKFNEVTGIPLWDGVNRYPLTVHVGEYGDTFEDLTIARQKLQTMATNAGIRGTFDISGIRRVSSTNASETDNNFIFGKTAETKITNAYPVIIYTPEEDNDDTTIHVYSVKYFLNEVELQQFRTTIAVRGGGDPTFDTYDKNVYELDATKPITKDASGWYFVHLKIKTITYKFKVEIKNPNNFQDHEMLNFDFGELVYELPTTDTMDDNVALNTFKAKVGENAHLFDWTNIVKKTVGDYTVFEIDLIEEMFKTYTYTFRVKGCYVKNKNIWFVPINPWDVVDSKNGMFEVNNKPDIVTMPNVNILMDIMNKYTKWDKSKTDLKSILKNNGLISTIGSKYATFFGGTNYLKLFFAHDTKTNTHLYWAPKFYKTKLMATITPDGASPIVAKDITFTPTSIEDEFFNEERLYWSGTINEDYYDITITSNKYYFPVFSDKYPIMPERADQYNPMYWYDYVVEFKDGAIPPQHSIFPLGALSVYHPWEEYVTTYIDSNGGNLFPYYGTRGLPNICMVKRICPGWFKHLTPYVGETVTVCMNYAFYKYHKLENFDPECLPSYLRSDTLTKLKPWLDKCTNKDKINVQANGMFMYTGGNLFKDIYGSIDNLYNLPAIDRLGDMAPLAGNEPSNPVLANWAFEYIDKLYLRELMMLSKAYTKEIVLPKTGPKIYAKQMYFEAAHTFGDVNVGTIFEEVDNMIYWSGFRRVNVDVEAVKKPYRFSLNIPPYMTGGIKESEKGLINNESNSLDKFMDNNIFIPRIKSTNLKYFNAPWRSRVYDIATVNGANPTLGANGLSYSMSYSNVGNQNLKDLSFYDNNLGINTRLNHICNIDIDKNQVHNAGFYEIIKWKCIPKVINPRYLNPRFYKINDGFSKGIAPKLYIPRERDIRDDAGRYIGNRFGNIGRIYWSNLGTYGEDNSINGMISKLPTSGPSLSLTARDYDKKVMAEVRTSIVSYNQEVDISSCYNLSSVYSEDTVYRFTPYDSLGICLNEHQFSKIEIPISPWGNVHSNRKLYASDVGSDIIQFSRIWKFDLCRLFNRFINPIENHFSPRTGCYAIDNSLSTENNFNLVEYRHQFWRRCSDKFLKHIDKIRTLPDKSMFFQSGLVHSKNPNYHIETLDAMRLINHMIIGELFLAALPKVKDASYNIREYNTSKRMRSVPYIIRAFKYYWNNHAYRIMWGNEDINIYISIYGMLDLFERERHMYDTGIIKTPIPSFDRSNTYKENCLIDSLLYRENVDNYNAGYDDNLLKDWKQHIFNPLMRPHPATTFNRAEVYGSWRRYMHKKYDDTISIPDMSDNLIDQPFIPLRPTMIILYGRIFVHGEIVACVTSKIDLATQLTSPDIEINYEDIRYNSSYEGDVVYNTKYTKTYMYHTVMNRDVEIGELDKYSINYIWHYGDLNFDKSNVISYIGKGGQIYNDTGQNDDRIGLKNGVNMAEMRKLSPDRFFRLVKLVGNMEYRLTSFIVKYNHNGTLKKNIVYLKINYGGSSKLETTMFVNTNVEETGTWDYMHTKLMNHILFSLKRLHASSDTISNISIIGINGPIPFDYREGNDITKFDNITLKDYMTDILNQPLEYISEDAFLFAYDSLFDKEKDSFVDMFRGKPISIIGTNVINAIGMNIYTHRYKIGHMTERNFDGMFMNTKLEYIPPFLFNCTSHGLYDVSNMFAKTTDDPYKTKLTVVHPINGTSGAFGMYRFYCNAKLVAGVSTKETCKTILPEEDTYFGFKNKIYQEYPGGPARTFEFGKKSIYSAIETRTETFMPSLADGKTVDNIGYVSPSIFLAMLYAKNDAMDDIIINKLGVNKKTLDLMRNTSTLVFVFIKWGSYELYRTFFINITAYKYLNLNDLCLENIKTTMTGKWSGYDLNKLKLVKTIYTPNENLVYKDYRALYNFSKWTNSKPYIFNNLDLTEPLIAVVFEKV